MSLPTEPREVNHDQRASCMRAKTASTAKRAKARRFGKLWPRTEWASLEKMVEPLRIQERRARKQWQGRIAVWLRKE